MKKSSESGSTPTSVPCRSALLCSSAACSTCTACTNFMYFHVNNGIIAHRWIVVHRAALCVRTSAVSMFLRQAFFPFLEDFAIIKVDLFTAAAF